MRCKRVDGLLERYLDGMLDSRTAEAVRDHLARCPRCAASERIARGIATEVAAADPAAGSRAPAHFVARVTAEAHRLTPPAARQAAGRARNGAAGGYRRLGLSFIASGMLLAASLLVQRGGYSTVVDAGLLAADLGKGKPTVIVEILRSAGGVVEGFTTLATDEPAPAGEVEK